MNVLIVDDETLARERLAALVQRVEGFEVIAQASNGREAVEQCQQHGADIVLMDIRMPVMDGLEAARHLARFDPAPAVIFCTAYDQHALAAWEAHALDFLVKPVRLERLEAALKRARRYSGEELDQLRSASDGNQDGQASRSHICARVRGNLQLIAVDDIFYFNAEDKYVIVHHRDGEVLIEEPLKSLEEEFAGRFVRIHRNCLVALEQIAGLQRQPEGQVNVVLKDCPDGLEVSRRNLPALRKRVRAL